MQNSGMNYHNPSPPPVKILVVDDYPNTAALLARSIARLGARVDVVSATSGRQALEHAQDCGPDILITDMDMPDMTGLELIEKLREHPRGKLVVSFLVTSSYASELKIRARELNVREVLHKPAPPERVCQIISQVLEEIERNFPCIR
jgi:CheY-like chemotaxis protein